jgi:DNA-binding NtrC family response regulator
MPAKFVIVHDDPTFTKAMLAPFLDKGCSVARYPDALDAMGAIEICRKMEVLVTLLAFPAGRSNGIALAQMAKQRKPHIRTVFLGDPAMEELVSDLGTLLPHPISPEKVLATLSGELDAAGLH